MVPLSIPVHTSHSLHGLPSTLFMQLTARENIFAVEVLPVPRVPQKRYAWAACPVFIAFLSVLVTDGWPTTVSKFTGLYFLAETIKLLIHWNHREQRY
jgi:hypothetical protein